MDTEDKNVILLAIIIFLISIILIPPPNALKELGKGYATDTYNKLNMTYLRPYLTYQGTAVIRCKENLTENNLTHIDGTNYIIKKVK